ncbi:MAG: HAD family hydrolase [Candidatus Bathyarchaeia archaeon]|jgi:phosphoglycolate phosphatase
MTIKAVIFDLDGTITAFNLDYMTLRSEVRGFLIRTGVPASVLFVNESIFDMLNKTEIFMKNSGKSTRTLEKVRNEALAIAERHELEAAKTTCLLPNVLETLKILKEMGLKIGLCTVNSEKSASYILKRFGVAGFFDAVIPRNKVKRVKPSGEHLEAVLKALKVSPKEALLVGDATRDMECAKELKVMAVGLSTGVSTQKELMNAGANYLVTSIADLPSLVETAKLDAKQNRKRRAGLK